MGQICIIEFIFVAYSDNHINLQEKKKNLSGKHEIKLKGIDEHTYRRFLCVPSERVRTPGKRSEQKIFKISRLLYGQRGY